MWKRILFLTPALLPLSMPVSAQDLEWHGFLNLVGGVLKNEPVADDSGKKQVTNYLKYTDDFTFDTQSTAGLQVSNKLDDKTSVTLQLFAAGDEGSYNASFKWLYLTYKPSQFSRFRIGRIATPVYYYSDFINVGYSYHWLSPPREIYSLDSTITGVDYVYQDVAGPLDWSLELFTGASNQYLSVLESQVDSHNTIGSVLSGSIWGWLSARALYFQTQTTLKPDYLKKNDYIGTAFDKAIAQGSLTQSQMDVLAPLLRPLVEARLAEPLALDNYKAKYLDLALRADFEQWFLMAEASKTTAEEYLYGHQHGGYITGGFRTGKVQYHLTQSRFRTKETDDVIADLHYALPANPGLEDLADAFSKSILTTFAGRIARNIETTTLGVRYDATSNVALKADVSYLKEAECFAGDTAGTGNNMLFRSGISVIF